MVIAVTGAAGYPGSHMLLSLAEAEEAYVPFDTARMLQRTSGNIEQLVVDPLADPEGLAQKFKDREVTEVIHFAGGGFVPLSIDDPLTYYRDNTLTAYTLISACMRAGVKRLVLSSTASVYGVPERMPINETAPVSPISPFGASMAMAERIAADVAAVSNLDIVVLRYFNLAGADPACRAGERGRPRHLIKVVAQIAVGTRQEKLQIYGDDYSTPDGTCVRDYVHVSDMADAHLAALNYLRKGAQTVTLNVGYGYGASVLDVVAAAERVIGRKIDTEVADRRAGDPPLLIADNAEIRTVLDWAPRFDDLDYIVQSAIDWEQHCKDESVQ
ncbi:UDP-glucose 4-epimerase GalE [Parvularcula sp. IMCC14364]|uniref:UDP-glucose 4-epimerase GalE n=1 Tax=Parvularcula sp. IMCC14364 TaxID=3067902 RepID=UPI0027408DEC|nr:UDP-glucose 4-epimerase GalE [Parvularcula sp. IMCC14364]